MGDPIRIIYPCKTEGCSFKIARTSVSGLCATCNDREYRKRKKAEIVSKKRPTEVRQDLRRKVGATICSAANCSTKLGDSPYRFCSEHVKNWLTSREKAL